METVPSLVEGTILELVVQGHTGNERRVFLDTRTSLT